MPPPAHSSIPSSPKPDKRHWRLAIGWLLAFPGLWVIASFLLFSPLSDWAGCPPPLGVDFRPCPPGLLAGLADVMRRSVAITLLLSFVGVGALPPLYSGLFVAIRIGHFLDRWWARRRGEGETPVRWGRVVTIAFVLFMGLALVAGMVSRILADAGSGRLSFDGFAEGLLGLAVMGGVAFAAFRLIRWGFGRIRGI